MNVNKDVEARGYRVVNRLIFLAVWTAFLVTGFTAGWWIAGVLITGWVLGLLQAAAHDCEVDVVNQRSNA